MQSTVILALILSASADNPKPKFEPTSAYVMRDVEGWKVRVHPDLLGKDQELGGRALRELEVQLYQVTRQVPPKALEKLKQVTFWLEKAEPHHPCATYHPSRDWLVENGMNPEKARCVEISNAATFVEWTRDLPWMVLHELSHAYHDQVVPGGFNHPGIAACYDAAVANKSYDAVLHPRRADLVRSYAMTNRMEYFAEASEAFFGANEFYPFNRVELLKHDPKLHDVLSEVWGVEASKRPKGDVPETPAR